MTDQQDDYEHDEDWVSKSARKRELHAVKDQVARLVELSATDLATLPLWPQLAEAMQVARKLPSTGARKRQIQFIAKLLRDEQGEQVLAGLARIDERRAGDIRRFHQLEALRDQLLASADPVALALERFPHVDRTRLRQLVRDSRTEQTAQSSPKNTRKLFKYLRELDIPQD